MRTVCLLYCVSGFVSLVYQVAWFRIFVDRFGSTNLTFGFVVCSFIGGLGVGSLASRPLAARISRHGKLNRQLRVYGVVEMMVAATAVLTLLMPLIPADTWGSFPYRLSGAIFRPIMAYQFSQLAISILCVFPPCFLMGVTFPLLCDVFHQDARFPSTLYGWNTLGACSGVLACEFCFLPLVGHSRTFLFMTAINFALGLYFFLAGAAPGKDSLRASTACKPRGSRPRRRSLVKTPQKSLADVPICPVSVSVALACAIISGLLTGALEADVLKRLQFLDCRSGASMSFISFWAILAIFLASWTVRMVRRLHLGWIKVAFVLALAAYLAAWHFAFPLRDWSNAVDNQRVIDALPADTTGLGIDYQFFHFRYGLRSLLLFTGVFVFPAFYLLSLLLPYVCNAMQSSRRHLGIVYGCNTVGFCAGMLGFTMAAPRVNVFYSFKLFMCLFALLAGLLLTIGRSKRLAIWKPGVAALILAAACVLTPASFDVAYFAADSAAVKYPIRAMKSNGANTTFVVEDPDGELLFFDSHSMSGCNAVAQQYMRLMAHYPLLCHPHPTKALLICFGVGTTASAIACHEPIEWIDVVELNDRVLDTAPEFAATNRNVVQDPRVRLIHDDGRRFLNLTDRKYDLITSEPPPPMFQGVYRLYSREYYQSVLARLAPGGMMTQWLPIGQMPRPAVEQAIGAFVSVFPHCLMFVGHGTNYILLGSNAPIELATIERRFHDSDRVVEDLKPFAISGPVSLFARLVKYGSTLRREFGDYPAVSDQRNDFSHALHDPSDPAVITYDPVSLLEQIPAGQLRSYEELRRTVLHMGRLKTLVMDFPEAALMSVKATGAAEVALADADWISIHRLFGGAMRAARQRRYEEGIEFLQQALHIANEVPYVAKWLGVLQNNAQNFDAALGTWKYVQTLEPGDADAYHGAGWALIRVGRYDEAIAELNRAIELDSNNAKIHRSLGDALASVHRWPEAVRAYDRALFLNPRDKTARENRDSLVDQMSRP